MERKFTLNRKIIQFSTGKRIRQDTQATVKPWIFTLIMCCISNLVSVKKWTKDGYKVSFKEGRCRIMKDGVVKGFAPYRRFDHISQHIGIKLNVPPAPPLYTSPKIVTKISRKKIQKREQENHSVRKPRTFTFQNRSILNCIIIISTDLNFSWIVGHPISQSKG